MGTTQSITAAAEDVTGIAVDAVGVVSGLDVLAWVPNVLYQLIPNNIPDKNGYKIRDDKFKSYSVNKMVNIDHIFHWRLSISSWLMRKS